MGRSPGCDLRLADAQVSKQHAVLERTPQGAVLRDLDSRNGIYVNEQRVQQVLLQGGEQLRLGQTRLQFVGGGTMRSDTVPAASGPTAHLALISPEGKDFNRRYSVKPGAMLGRYAGCPVDLKSDARVSQRHAQLGYQDGRWYIADLQSHNRTFVNGSPVTSQWLEEGDVIRLGNTRMRFYP
jgi:pSer/pThr/pTyr-binding forkhead associated (FHA) protein